MWGQGEVHHGWNCWIRLLGLTRHGAEAAESSEDPNGEFGIQDAAADIGMHAGMLFHGNLRYSIRGSIFGGTISGCCLAYRLK